MKHTGVFYLAAVLGVLGCDPGAPDTIDTGIDTGTGECQLQSDGDKSPGYPFDLTAYRTKVLPALAASCGMAGCHGAPSTSQLTLWGDASPGDCDYARTFNSIASAVDLKTPGNSALVASSTAPTHPVAFSITQEPLATVTSWISDASARYLGDGGGGATPPPGASPFDYDVYQQEIQPLLDAAKPAACATVGCHGTGAGGFTLNATPARDSDAMEANFLAVTSLANLADPVASLIYVRSTVRHASGSSSTISVADGESIIDWMEDAATRKRGVESCAPIEEFNLGVFRAEIMPILEGRLDLNRPGEAAARTGCTASVCHGQDRGPGALFLDALGDPADNLRQLTCYMDLIAPTRSEVLACPLSQPGCRRFPHPGQTVFTGPEDRNYQRILSFIYSARSANAPFDLAFFARKINPIFNDLGAVDSGAQGRTCAETTGCHGVSIAGQTAPNGSNFPIIPNASDAGRIGFNFVAATSFVDFLDPEQSSLFLYPTNVIQAQTGLAHPGGADFASDSDEALAILKWARGLRPDSSGFLRDWLVAGDFPATLISDVTLVDEFGVAPTIFETSGGAFAAGEWDGLFSDAPQVDFDQVFPRAQRGDRVAYAVAYLVNTLPVSLTVELRVESPNALRAYVNQQIAAQSFAGGVTSVLAALPPAGGPPVRVLLKLLEDAGDGGFAFTAELRDERGALITDDTGEVIVVLSPNGGI